MGKTVRGKNKKNKIKKTIEFQRNRYLKKYVPKKSEAVL